MKNNKKLILVALILLTVLSLKAQLSEGGTPVSFKRFLKSAGDIPVEKMEPVDHEELLKEDSLNTGKKGAYRFAKRFFVEYNTTDFGLWQVLDDGARLWRLGIQSEGAYSINIIFSKYKLPEGAKLFLYNESREHILGAYTHLNNKETEVLAVQPVYGDKMYIELYVPADAAHEPELIIGQIGHDYKGVFVNPKSKIIQKSGTCNVDINCTEGDEWQKEKRAVCKMIIDGTYLCTGTLVNNTKEDGKPYLLTAHHCVDHDPKGMGPKIVYYFNYENTSCDGGGASSNQTISGSALRATTPNLDFCLYEMSQVPPVSYKPYYAGWDRSGTDPTYVTCIHHPGGDVKKISADSDGATTASYGYDYRTHWKVPSWDFGTTEGGSSGSGLFDQNHRLIGDLTGGDASCGNSVNDYFAQFHYSWDKYPETGKQLKAWLDPDNSGVVTLDGYDPQSGNTFVPVTGVVISPNSIIVNEQESYKLNVYVTPENASNKSIRWTSNNTSIATVTTDGKVTGVSEGVTKITVKTQDGGYIAEADVTVKPKSLQEAYPHGVPHKIPGIVEAVYFDRGGEGIAYHDADGGNSGNGPRNNTNVDTERRTTPGNIGWIRQGEWLEYTVDVEKTGRYNIEVQVASPTNAGKFHIEFDGKDETDIYNVNSTGDWGAFKTLNMNKVELTKGKQIMRVYMDGPDFNLARMEFKLSNSQIDSVPPTAPDSLIANDVTSNSVILSWKASSDNIGVSEYEIISNKEVIQSTTSTNVKITELITNTSYKFTVRAKDEADNVSPESDAVRIITQDANADDGGRLINGTFAYGKLDEEDGSDMWFIDVPNGISTLRIFMECGDKDFDTYGRYYTKPTTRVYDWRGFTLKGEDNTVYRPSVGRHYIMVDWYKGEGEYSIKATFNDKSDSNQEEEKEEVTGVEEQMLAEEILVFPNPSEGDITISTLNGGNIQSVSIVNTTGRPVYSRTNVNTGNLLIQELNPGLYIMNILLDNKLYQKKIIIK